MNDLNVTQALLKAILELIEKCATLEELRESVKRMLLKRTRYNAPMSNRGHPLLSLVAFLLPESNAAVLLPVPRFSLPAAQSVLLQH